MKIYILVDASHNILKVTTTKEKCEEYVEELHTNYTELLSLQKEIRIRFERERNVIHNCSLTDAWKRDAEFIYSLNISEKIKCTNLVYANHFKKEHLQLSYLHKDHVKILEWEVE